MDMSYRGGYQDSIVIYLIDAQGINEAAVVVPVAVTAGVADSG
jgi:hypothetical protein